PDRSLPPEEQVKNDDGGQNDAGSDQSGGNGALPHHRSDQGASEDLPQGIHLPLGGQDGGPPAGVPDLFVEPRAVDRLVGFPQDGGGPIGRQGDPPLAGQGKGDNRQNQQSVQHQEHPHLFQAPRPLQPATDALDGQNVHHQGPGVDQADPDHFVQVADPRHGHVFQQVKGPQAVKPLAVQTGEQADQKGGLQKGTPPHRP